MQANQIAQMAALSEVEITVIAYEEAAGGDSAQALRFAVEDILALEKRLGAAVKAVSSSYVRGDLTAAR